MAKGKKDIMTEAEGTQIVVEAPVPTVSGPARKAFSIINENNLWQLVEVEFYPLTGTAGSIKILAQNTSKTIITQEFKVHVAKTLLMQQ